MIVIFDGRAAAFAKSLKFQQGKAEHARGLCIKDAEDRGSNLKTHTACGGGADALGF